MRRRHRIVGLGLALGLGLLLVPQLRAQNARGSVLGHIQDPSGAAVPHAKITLRNVQTNVTSTFVTTNVGDYQFVNLIPGTYEVTVAAPGFKSAVSSDLILQVDQTLRQNFTLTVGEVAQQVTVSAESQMVQADNPTIGQVINSQQLRALPISGRDFTNLLQVNAGVTTAVGGIQNSVFDTHGLNTQFSMVSVNGARPGSISYIIDGFTDTDFFFTKAVNIPPADAIQEFKLQNGLYSAQYGFGSAQVNVAVRSGTNQLHGLVYDFLENSALQPTNPVQSYLKKLNPGGSFALKPAFQQNQFGGQLGGPVVLPRLYNGRDRSFWFFSYSGGRYNAKSLRSYQMPTAEERQGNFSDWPDPIYDPLTTGSLAPTATDTSGRAPFPNNQIPSARFNPVAAKLLNFFPAPNFTCTMPCTNFIGNVKSRTTTDTYTGRFDHNLSSRDQLSFTFNTARDLQPGGVLSLLPASSQNVTDHASLFGLHYQRTFNPTTVLELHAGYTRENFHEGADSAFGPNLSSQLGFQNVPNIPAFYGLPVVSLGDGYSGPGTGNNGYAQIDNIFQYAGNVTKLRGRHSLHMGADVRRAQLWDVDGFVVNGSLSFPGAYTASDPIAGARGRIGPTAGNGFADLLLGNPLGVGAPVPLGSDAYFLRGTQWGMYFQDDFHATPRLTLNLGLRYEIPATFHSISNSGSVINLTKPAGGGLFWADPKFVQNFANPTVASTYFQCCVTNKLVPGRKNDFFPRIGFAWRPLSTTRFVVRGGFGMYSGTYMRFYDGTNYDENALFVVQPNPNYPAASGSETVSPLSLSGLWLPPQIINPFTSFPAAWQFGVQTEWPLNKNPYDEQWSLDTQYALTSNLLLDVGYVGGRGLHLPTQYFFNTGTLPTTPDIIKGPTGSPVVCNGLRDASQAVRSFAGCLATGSAFQPIDTRVGLTNFSAGSYANANVLDSSYSALQVRLDQRFASGLSLLANYTWSRSLDMNSEIATFSNNGGDGNETMNNHDLHQDWGPADFDQTNRLVLSYVYEPPIGKGKRLSLGPANWVLGGWQTSGIVTLASGYPFSVSCCARGNRIDLTGDPFGARLRANVDGPLYTPHFQQSITHWFNTSAFSVPAYGTYGNSGRNILRAPMLRQGNLSFMKDFPIGERHRLQARLDIFNVFSSWHTGAFFPVHTMTSPYFGSLVVTNGPLAPLGKTLLWTPRVLQVALRYSF